jgi:short-subunit dehydrogenase
MLFNLLLIIMIDNNIQVPYCGSKFAVRGIMEALSEELRAKTNGTSNINFTNVCPYMIDTGFKYFLRVCS